MSSSVQSLSSKEFLSGNDDLCHKKTISGSHKWAKINAENDGVPAYFHKAINNHRSNDVADKEEVFEHFNKKFAFKPPEQGWNLPMETNLFQDNHWTIDNFMKLKKQLNEVKNKLNNYNLDEWHKHTRVMNKSGNLLWAIKKNICPEFVTQAWLKFYEICSSYDFVHKAAQLNSVHLCEAPGAFITSLNHYLKLNCPDMKWDWISTTLNPYHEENPLSIMINDDRFILHTLDHWKFGEDYTGNLMDIKNFNYLLNEANKMGPVLMVTADGSIDCQNDPGEQESIVSRLIYCEIVCALHILAEGGNFVVKMFTMYEKETICLMFLLVCSFKSVNVYKPAASKEGNSENYVVCLNYKGKEAMKPWLRQLEDHYGEEPLKKVMFRLSDIPKEFIDQLYECAKKFKNYQVEVIERNIFLFQSENNQQSINRTKRLKYVVAEEYIKRYKLRPLDLKEQEIVGEDTLRKTETPNMDKKWEEGTFNDKIEREKMAPIIKLKNLYEDVEKMKIEWEYEEDIIWLKFSIDHKNKFKVVVGKSVTSVNSSKFCSGRLLQIRNEVRKLAKENYPDIYKVNINLKPDKLISPSKELSDSLKKNIFKNGFLKDSKNITLNYKEQLWESLESGQNEFYESNVFFDIMDTIADKIWRGYNLIIQGFPMLTQFTAGVIYLLGHLFEEVGFCRPSGQDFAVIFREYRSCNPLMDNFVKNLDSKMDKLCSEKNKSVLSIIPIDELIYRCEGFYSCVTAVNNLCVKEQIKDIFNRVTNAIQKSI